jgi:hypothetical protein
MDLINAGGLIFLLLVGYSLFLAHKGNTPFNLLDLLMHEGRVDKLACVFMGSWAVHSWIMINLTTSGKMSEGYVTLYAATWIAPIITKLIAKKT